MDIEVRDRMLATMSAQHGLITLEQIRSAGASAADLRVAKRQGWLEPAGCGVYRSPAATETLDHRRTFALLAAGPSAMLSHRCAAELLGFDRFTAGIVELTLPRAAHGRRLPCETHTTQYIGPLDRITVRGYPCTSGTRTVIDLARLRVPVVQTEAAIDSSVRLGWSSPWVIVRRLSELRGPGRWGAPLLDRLLLDSGGHTLLERRFLELVRTAGFQRPQTQVIYRADGTTVARVDFTWEEYGVVVEVSGSKGHASPSERARDAQRRNELQDLGRRVYEYTWEHVTQRADWVATTLRHRLQTA